MNALYCGMPEKAENSLLTREEFNKDLASCLAKQREWMKDYFPQEKIEDAIETANRYHQAEFRRTQFEQECAAMDNCDINLLMKYHSLSQKAEKLADELEVVNAELNTSPEYVALMNKLSREAQTKKSSLDQPLFEPSKSEFSGLPVDKQ